jgi:hypothetical protein
MGLPRSDVRFGREMLSPVRSVVADILYAQVMEFLLRLVEWKRLSGAGPLRMML